MVKITEMPKRGPNKKLTKTRATEIAKDVLISNLAKAYYGVEDGINNPADKYGLSEEEIQLVYSMVDTLANKMAKSIGRDYYSV